MMAECINSILYPIWRRFFFGGLGESSGVGTSLSRSAALWARLGWCRLDPTGMGSTPSSCHPDPWREIHNPQVGWIFSWPMINRDLTWEWLAASHLFSRWYSCGLDWNGLELLVAFLVQIWTAKGRRSGTDLCIAETKFGGALQWCSWVARGLYSEDEKFENQTPGWTLGVAEEIKGGDIITWYVHTLHYIALFHDHLPALLGSESHMLRTYYIFYHQVRKALRLKASQPFWHFECNRYSEHVIALPTSHKIGLWHVQI